MEVRNELFLHIWNTAERAIEPKTGTTITANPGQRNPYMQFYDRAHMLFPVPGEPKGAHLIKALERIMELSQNEQMDFCVKQLSVIKQVVKEQASFVRDVIFEEVRKARFPFLPSRYSCIYLCRPHSLEYWYNILPSDRPVVEVLATGIIHRGDDRWLAADVMSHNELREHALKYWSGPTEPYLKEEEILFEGTLRVERSFKNFQAYVKARGEAKEMR